MVRLNVKQYTGNLYAEYVHVVKLTRALTDSEEERVHALLSYETNGIFQSTDRQPSLTVVPRLGTISPWSSKATEIFRLCELPVIERVERGVRWWVERCDDIVVKPVIPLLFDRMTETILWEETFDDLFVEDTPKPLGHVALGEDPRAVLEQVNVEWGLALSAGEIDYLQTLYARLERDPTDVELMMFAQANSEHCRHKIFNASWEVDGKKQNGSLFDSIRATSMSKSSQALWSAYQDNAAVVAGTKTSRLEIEPKSRRYTESESNLGILMKVETHNHPTAISPYPGAATGSGGEIRDEGAVGRGSKPKAGLVGFTTSHLRIQEDPQPWEHPLARPSRISSPFEVMRDGPIGAAAFNNEFGRPALLGYFRTFEQIVSDEVAWGYHKPVMIAGGLGSVHQQHVSVTNSDKSQSMLLVVLGGPAMLIGLGGGAASSMQTGTSDEDLDFASVQRDNAEMQRRCQEVIDRCCALGDDNPIVKIHDVGAGGLSNALPELAKDLSVGARIDLKDVPNADSSMSPMELWCNEAQERYVIALSAEGLAQFTLFCERERCPYAVVGTTVASDELVVEDLHSEQKAVDLPMEGLFGSPPRMERRLQSKLRPIVEMDLGHVTIAEAVSRTLRFPAVASKKFLVTIGDRSISGLVVQEQMVGPYQVPIADVAITSAGFNTSAGEAMSMGERSPLAVVHPVASARMAIAEALTNLCSVKINSIEDVVISANWMATAGYENEDQALYEAVRDIGESFCQELGVAIPVGKDSLSMTTRWDNQVVASPMTLIASAFAPVPDVLKFKTSALQKTDSILVLLAVSDARRLGGSAIAQVFSQYDGETPNVESPTRLAKLFEVIQQILMNDEVLSIHDRSDGGLLTTILEMAIAGRIGVEINTADDDWLSFLFNEEVGVVLELESDFVDQVHRLAQIAGLYAVTLGNATTEATLKITCDRREIYSESLIKLEERWGQTSYEMQRRRDNPDVADQERELVAQRDAGLNEDLKFRISEAPETLSKRPLVGILRDQGVNGHLEMAAAFRAAGFEAIDVHMTDLFERRESLNRFQVMVACGGFSYGDVLGGGGGWAKSILYNEQVRVEFEDFFNGDTLTLGVCNGCQMFAQLKDLIPGAESWPTWAPNTSGRFEGRMVQVRVSDVGTPWLEGMAGSRLTVPVAHGEGRLNCGDVEFQELSRSRQVALQYVDGEGNPTEVYPLNPNGSIAGTAGLVSLTGKVLIMMPHPERVFRNMQQTWMHPYLRQFSTYSGWIQMFQNARTIFR